jgi:hypothetical protein
MGVTKGLLRYRYDEENQGYLVSAEVKLAELPPQGGQEAITSVVYVAIDRSSKMEGIQLDLFAQALLQVTEDEAWQSDSLRRGTQVTLVAFDSSKSVHILLTPGVHIQELLSSEL